MSLGTWLEGAIIALGLYVFAWPYLAARLQEVVWRNTRFGDVRFRTDIRAWPLFRLVFRNVALTLLSCGLYWPFAAMALTRYRIQCVTLESDAPRRG